MTGYVYFITDGELVKIGITNSVNARLRELQTGSSRRLSVLQTIQCEAPTVIEARIHRAYKHMRVTGEWFNIAHQDVQDICARDWAMVEDVMRPAYDPSTRRVKEKSEFSRRGWRIELNRKPSGLLFWIMRRGRNENRQSHYLGVAHG